MSRLYLAGVFALAALAALGVGAGLGQETAPLDPQRGPVLERFASAAEFQRYLRTVRQRREMVTDVAADEMVMSAPPAPMQAQEAAGMPGNPEITNNQTV